METTNKLFYSGTKFFTENEEDYRITVRISLDDDCKNNICDWSITADVDWKNKHGKYEDYLGGCCHDEVAKHFPELAKFISLHLCNHYGAPMYPVENGIYHVRRSGMSVAMEYLRISEQECAELYKASEDELYFKYMLFNLGIVNRWKRESEELINVNATQSLSALIMVLRIACFGKHLKNWIWMLVMPHGFTSPAAATTASTIGE